MDQDQFREYCEGIDNGKNLPSDFLDNLYHGIKNDPLVVKHSIGEIEIISFTNPEISGKLYTCEGRLKKWKERWFILSYNTFSYFKQKNKKKHVATISLNDEIKIITKTRTKQPKYIIKLFLKTPIDLQNGNITTTTTSNKPPKKNSRKNSLQDDFEFIFSVQSYKEMSFLVRNLQIGMISIQLENILSLKKRNFIKK
ncbi:cytohesin 4a-related [Anaeramoeba flamelloides]|uniref:Cytohesin 4a-related n=1 Tax=Anaeramoeba flamelloides TaxID=1746091 RepID=A0AAV7YB99_9EUKA|nr:cytohesin 4a-related [Anaeramoeba flamelloides]